VGNRLLFVPIVVALLLGAIALRQSRSDATDPGATYATSFGGPPTR